MTGLGECRVLGLRSKGRVLHIKAANDEGGLVAYGWDEWEDKCRQRKLHLWGIDLVRTSSCARGIDEDVSFH